MNKSIAPSLKLITQSAIVISLLATTPLLADWTLQNERSNLSYISTKVMGDGKASAAETNYFKGLSGSVSSDGTASINIDLNSVETNVDIRNDRMKKHVFEIEKFAQATATAKVPEAVLASGTHYIDLEFELDLHGVKKTITTPVVVNSTETSVIVTTQQAVILSASDFELEGGLQMLTKLAKLFYVPGNVPVSFSLDFAKE